MAMYFFTFEATPSRDHPIYCEIGGAFVNCWIAANTSSDAENIARNSIKDQKWVIQKLIESHPDDRNLYDDDAPSLRYYQQALIDKEVFVFHTYPVEDEVDVEVNDS